MKLSTKEDIEAPVEFVFDAVSDFDGYERAALRRGVQVKRLDDLTGKGPGMQWAVDFRYRGRPRSVTSELRGFDRPNGMEFHAESNSLLFTPVITLVALSKKRTRLGVELDVRPKTMAARLLLQSLKLAKTSMRQRFQARVRGLAEDIEARHARHASRV